MCLSYLPEYKHFKGSYPFTVDCWILTVKYSLAHSRCQYIIIKFHDKVLKMFNFSCNDRNCFGILFKKLPASPPSYFCTLLYFISAWSENMIYQGDWDCWIGISYSQLLKFQCFLTLLPLFGIPFSPLFHYVDSYLFFKDKPSYFLAADFPVLPQIINHALICVCIILCRFFIIAFLQ